MQIKLSIYALIPLLTVIQAFIFSILLIIRGWQQERKSDFWLSLLLILIALSNIPFMLGWMGIGYLWENLTFLPWDGFDMAIPPTIYLFLRCLTNVAFRFRKKDWLFYLPYFLYFFYHLGIGLQGKEVAKAWWQNQDKYLNIGFELLLIFLQFFFLYQAIHLFKVYQKWTETRYSDIEKVSFSWFRNFLIVFSLVTSIHWIFKITDFFFEYDYAEMWWIYMTSTLFTYYLSISGYTQGFIPNLSFQYNDDTFSEATENVPIYFQENDAENALGKNMLTVENLLEWKQKIAILMEKEAYYLNPDISLPELAEKLHTNTSILSYIINKGFEKNFNDFINEYRIRACVQKMNDSSFSHYSLLGIAFSCGFNSKTTFNRAFKKVMDKTPKDYLFELKNQQ